MEAQTTRLASFGPVIVVVAFCKHLHVFKYIISTYTYQLIQKKKFTHLGPRRREMRHLGTFLMPRPSLLLLLSLLSSCGGDGGGAVVAPLLPCLLLLLLLWLRSGLSA